MCNINAFFFKNLNLRKEQNTMLDNYASAKLACLHPLQLHASNNLNMQYDRSLQKEFITDFVINVSQLSGEILTFKK